MSWRQRLIELAVAGGTLVPQPGCVPGTGGPGCGNANPDPCICGKTPDPAHDPQCIAERTCTDNGGYWDFYSNAPATDAGVGLWGRCEGFPLDAGLDASRLPDASTVLPDAVPAD